MGADTFGLGAVVYTCYNIGAHRIAKAVSLDCFILLRRLLCFVRGGAVQLHKDVDKCRTKREISFPFGSRPLKIVSEWTDITGRPF